MFDTSLRGRLRAATSESHAALDASAMGLGIETRAGYSAFLKASSAALTPLELALERDGVDGWLPDWSRRIRRNALAVDLAALGLAPPSAALSTPPLSPSQGAGVLYVLEGSRLGARVLSRKLRSVDAGLPLAYLTHGEGDDLWRTFLAWLEAPSNVEFQTDEVEAGARYGFQCFSDAFEAASSGELDVRAGDRVGV